MATVLAVGCRLSAIGYRLSAIGDELLEMRYRSDIMQTFSWRYTVAQFTKWQNSTYRLHIEPFTTMNIRYNF